MKLLHILRSEPNEMTRFIIDQMSRGEAKSETPLYSGPVNYDKLVEEIFRSDRVICWW
jgi:hypothetical protein